MLILNYNKIVWVEWHGMDNRMNRIKHDMAYQG